MFVNFIYADESNSGDQNLLEYGFESVAEIIGTNIPGQLPRLSYDGFFNETRVGDVTYATMQFLNGIPRKDSDIHYNNVLSKRSKQFRLRKRNANGTVNNSFIDINKFLFVLGFAVHGKDLSPGQLEYLYNLTAKKAYPNYKLLSELNEPSFTNKFINDESDYEKRVWYFLNSNPGAFWTNGVLADLTTDMKAKISYEVLFYQILHEIETGTFPSFKEIYEKITNSNSLGEAPGFTWRQGIIHNGKYIQLQGNPSRFGNHWIDFNFKPKGFSDGGVSQRDSLSLRTPTQIITREQSFTVNINSTLFFNAAQTDTSLLGQTVTEKVKTHTFTSENTKKISEFGKKDRFFNVFKKDFNDQNNKSLVKQYVNSLINAPFVDEDATDITLKKNEAAAKGQLSVSVEELEDLLTDESQDFSDRLSQCILLTSLKDIARYSTEMKVKEREEALKKNNSVFSYGSRIYSVDTEKPNTLINILSTPRGISRYVSGVKSTDFGVNRTIQYNMQLCRVEEVSGSTKEYPYLFEEDTDAGGKSPIFKDLILNAYKNPSANDELKNSYVFKAFRQNLTPNKQGMNSLIRVDDLSISIKGETVATVKSNIDVSITFSLPSLEAMLGVFEAESSYYIDDDPSKGRELYEYSFSELLAHNVASKFDGTNASRVLNTSYIPKKNRLIMKIIPQINKIKQLQGLELGTSADNKPIAGDEEKEYKAGFEDPELINYFSESGMVLDLLLVDYSVVRNDFKTYDKITINYKGFMKSFLNEPFCDIIAKPSLRQQLLEKEKAVVEELESHKDYCDIKKVRERIQIHYNDMRTTRDQALNSSVGRNSILEKLVSRNRMFAVTLNSNILGSLVDNVDKNTRKITNPAKVAELLVSNGNIKDSINRSIDLNYAGDENIVNSKDIDFFYFGDLLDVIMDVIYGNPTYSNNNTGPRNIDTLRNKDGKIKPDILDDGTVSEIREKFANFPLKIILPVINPITLKKNSDGTSIFVTSKNKEDRISLADIPISVPYFQNWYEEEISRRKTKIYPLGTMVNKLLNLVNNILSDNCYTIGNINKKYFSIKTDYGTTLNENGEFNEDFYNNNYTIFDQLWESQYYDSSGKPRTNPHDFITVSTADAPLLEKRLNIERNKHTNYLIVYEQFNSYPDGTYPNAENFAITLPSGVTAIERNFLNAADIPQFKMMFEDTGRTNKTIDFVNKMDFSKTELPRAQEIRFFNDGLNELSTLSAVHDCTINCQPLIQFFPGMLCWIDSQFVDGSEVYGSIPWIMGLGGFHIVYEVEHKGNIVNSHIDKFTTTFKAKFVHSGAKSDTTSFKRECGDGLLELPSPEHESEPTTEGAGS